MVTAPDMVLLKNGHVGDLDAVMVVMDRAFAPCFGEAWTRSQCAGILPMSGVRLTVAEWRGAIVGFSLMRTIMDEAELLLLAVDPSAQGQGVGRSLLQHFITNAREGGASKLHLEVRDGNHAVRLYRQADFEIVGRRHDYYRSSDGRRFDALTMSIPVSMD